MIASDAIMLLVFSGGNSTKVSTAFCEQKAAKKLRFFLRTEAPHCPLPRLAEVFWFFFSKKEPLAWALR
jgi:hypothetical protein